MSKPIFKVQTLSVYISTTMVLMLLGAMGILFVAAREISKSVQDNLSVSVIIGNEASEKEITSLRQSLEADAFTESVRYISREQALEEQKAELKSDPVEQLGYNPYEAELEITLKPEYANSDSLALIEKRLLREKSIKEVIYQRDLMNSVNSSIKKTGAILFLLLAMLTLISWSLISNLVRLSIYSKRFLLHTMKLTGATWSFIRRPFICNNLWTGLLSGVAANLILAIALFMLQKQEPAILAYLPKEQLACVGGVVILFGITICSLCAFLSVNKFLRMRNNDLYFI